MQEPSVGSQLGCWWPWAALVPSLALVSSHAKCVARIRQDCLVVKWQKSSQTGWAEKVLAHISDKSRVAPASCMDGSRGCDMWSVSVSLCLFFPLTTYPPRRPNSKEPCSPPVTPAKVLGVALIDSAMVTFYLWTSHCGWGGPCWLARSGSCAPC